MYTLKTVEETLKNAFTCHFLEIIDESGLHQRHFEGNGLSHLRVHIVADEFEGISLLSRQRLVNKVMQPYFDQGLHALALTCATPASWKK